MIDSFAEFYPKAQERFTCWDQYRNRRHQNEGSRIDYIFVDRPFFQQHASSGAGLASHGHQDPDSTLAALKAATYGGLAQPASFNGGMFGSLNKSEKKTSGQMDFICYFGGVGPVSDFPQVKLFLDVFIFFKKM
eukprot:symbB.v1.2.037535.t1/scaffold5572.1/size25760/3